MVYKKQLLIIPFVVILSLFYTLADADVDGNIQIFNASGSNQYVQIGHDGINGNISTNLGNLIFDPFADLMFYGNTIIDGNLTATILNLTDGLMIGSGAEGVGIGVGGYMAIGNGANAGGGDSISIGTDTFSSGGNSFAMGYGAETNGNVAFSLGRLTFANGDYSYALGNNVNATGNNSYVFGRNMTVSGDGSVGFNLNNVFRTVTTDNVFSVMGGNVGIGTTTPSEKLEINGAMTWTNNGTIMVYPNGCSLISNATGNYEVC